MPDHKSMTPKQERMMLYRHGTRPSALTAGAIAQVAKADLRHRVENEKIRAIRNKAKGEGVILSPNEANEKDRTLYRYGFHHAHVRGAETPVEIIDRAIAAPELGLGCSDVNRQMIYESVDRLVEAKRILEAAHD